MQFFYVESEYYSPNSICFKVKSHLNNWKIFYLSFSFFGEYVSIIWCKYTTVFQNSIFNQIRVEVIPYINISLK